jgi:hypothetical protein
MEYHKDVYTKWQVAILTTPQQQLRLLLAARHDAQCWKERPPNVTTERHIVGSQTKLRTLCGPFLSVSPADFLVDSNNPIRISIDPVVLVQYVESHKILIY